MSYKTPKNTKVTGFFAPIKNMVKRAGKQVVETASDAMKLPSRIKAGAGKVLDAYEAKLKTVDEEKRKKNTKMIEKNFGSVENYQKIMNKK